MKKGRIGDSYRSALAAKGAIDEGSADAGHAESKPQSPKRCRCNGRTRPNELQANHGRGQSKWVGTRSSPPYVSAKETTPSPSRSKNDACLYRSVVAAPCGSPNAAARPTSQNQERTNSASRVAGENRDAQMRSAKQIMTDAPAEAERLTNRTERRREAAKAQPPPLGTPVVAEPCPSPFSGDSPSTRPCRARAQANCSPLSLFLFGCLLRSTGRGGASSFLCGWPVAMPHAPPRPLKYRWTGRSPQDS